MKYICILFLSLAFAACIKPVKKRNNQITKFEMASGGCIISYSKDIPNCPVYAISIDSSLSYKYYGGPYAELQGNYTGKVTQGFWDTLNIKMEDINFKNIDTTTYYPMDGGRAEAIYYWEKSKRRITFPLDRRQTDQSKHVFWWIAESYRHIKLRNANDTPAFEVTDHIPKPPKPEPAREIIKIRFPPAN